MSRVLRHLVLGVLVLSLLLHFLSFYFYFNNLVKDDGPKKETAEDMSRGKSEEKGKYLREGSDTRERTQEGPGSAFNCTNDVREIGKKNGSNLLNAILSMRRRQKEPLEKKQIPNPERLRENEKMEEPQRFQFCKGKAGGGSVESLVDNIEEYSSCLGNRVTRIAAWIGPERDIKIWSNFTYVSHMEGLPRRPLYSKGLHPPPTPGAGEGGHPPAHPSCREGGHPPPPVGVREGVHPPPPQGLEGYQPPPPPPVVEGGHAPPPQGLEGDQPPPPQGDEGTAAVAPNLLLVFLSLSSNSTNRERARTRLKKEWTDKISFRYLFLLPRFDSSAANEMIYQESAVYRDILQTDISPADPHFVHLQELSILSWVWSVWGMDSVPHYLVLSHETYLLPCKLFERFLKAERWASNRIYGTLMRGFKIGDSSDGRLPAKKFTWPVSRLPAYLGGRFRIFSSDTIPRLLLVAPRISMLSPAEVWLTGLVAPHARVLTVNLSGLPKL